jgi:glycosyltransferase involved in cell wall biosynthesis
MRKDSMSKPRVCIVRQTDLYELPVQREAEALADAGYDVEVLCMRRDDRPRETTINGVRISSLPTSLKRSSRVMYALSYLWFFLLVDLTLTMRHIRRPYAAVQVNTMPDFLVFATIFPKLFGAKIFLYMHEPTPELAETIFGKGMISKTLAFVEQRSLAFANHSFTVTDQLKQRYVERGARGDKITVVLNGVDPKSRFGDWQPSDAEKVPGKFTVICHGTIVDRYGQDNVLDAAKLLRAEMPDLRIVLAGRGPDADAIEQRISDEHLEDTIAFMGWVSEERLNDLLNAADAGIVAQKASPYSHLVHTNKMVDYWLFGLPAIASRLRAVSESYDDSTLEYYEPGDAADLARAIKRLHDDPARREELARNGRLAQERNGWEAQKSVYLAPFRQLLGPERVGSYDQQNLGRAAA